VYRIGLSNIDCSHVLKRGLSSGLQLQGISTRSVNEDILKCDTECLSLNIMDSGVRAVDNIGIFDVNRGPLYVFVESAEPNGSHTEIPVVITVSRS